MSGMPYKCLKCGYVLTTNVVYTKWKPKKCPKCGGTEFRYIKP
jgi:predicted  nucleic acid-binding Zn-ribbon protein